MREPVDRVRLQQAFDGPAAGWDPGQLSMAWTTRVLLCIEIQPSAVWRVLRPVEVAAAGQRVAGFASGRCDEREPPWFRKRGSRQLDEGGGRTVRTDAVEEVIAARIMRHSAGLATRGRRDVDMPVVGGQVDQPSRRIENMII